MPGHPLSGVPEAPRTKKGQLHMGEWQCSGKSSLQWIARLETEGDKEEGPCIPAEAKYNMRCQLFKEDSGQSEHQAFQRVLQWLWGKWKYWQESQADLPAPVNFPAHVEAALKPCPMCSGVGPGKASFPNGECSAMKALWGEELRPGRPPPSCSAESGG